VCLFGESNPIIGEGIGKPTWPQRITWTSSTRARAAVFKRGESNGHDPNPDDLRAGKVKHGESHVEAC
jgi:hypothetical protein